SRPLGQVVGLLVAIALTVITAWAVRARVASVGVQLATVGIVVIVLGTLAFARDPIEPIGLGARANVVSSLGAAAAGTGLGVGAGAAGSADRCAARPRARPMAGTASGATRTKLSTSPAMAGIDVTSKAASATSQIASSGRSRRKTNAATTEPISRTMPSTMG